MMTILLLIISLLLSPGSALAAVAFSAGATASGSNITSLTISTLNVTGSDRYLMACEGNQTVSNVTGITHAGNGMTSKVSTAAGGMNSECYERIAPTTGTNNIVYSWAAAVFDVVAIAMSFTGTHQTTPSGTAGTLNTNAANPLINITVPTNGLGVDFLARSGSCDTITVGAGQTLRAEIIPASSHAHSSSSADSGSNDMNWSSTNVGCAYTAMVAFPLNEAPAGVTPLRKIIMVN